MQIRRLKDSSARNLSAKNVIRFSKILISLARSVRTNTFLRKLGKTYIWDFQNKRDGRWYHYIDRAIKWHDERYVKE